MGNCLGGTARIGAAVPASITEHSSQRGNDGSVAVDGKLAVTDASSQFVDGLYRQLNNSSYSITSSSMNKNRRYFVFNRGDLIPRLHHMGKQTRSEGAEGNCLNIQNYQVFTKPKRQLHLRYQQQQQLSTTSNNRDDQMTSGCISPMSLTTMTPSSPSEYYYNGPLRSESRNTNTITSSPSSLDCVFLKVPSMPPSLLDGLPPKRFESSDGTTMGGIDDDKSAASPFKRPSTLSERRRSNTLDTVTSVSNPDLFRSIKESHSVTRAFGDTGYTKLNQYLLKHEIGRGSYGVVKLAYNEEDNKHYAMKVLSKKRLLRRAALQARNPKFRKNPFDPMEKLHREIAILKKLNHPNVVKLVEVLDDPNEDNLYLVFELVAQGEVLSIPTENPLTEEISWKYFRDVVLGLEYLHFQKVIHRDIKPANLLLDDHGRIKIADFGVSNQFSGADASLSSCTGTPVFLAPELLEPDPIARTSRHISGRSADIWSLGITLYCFLYGTVPWLENSNPALFKRIINDTLTFPERPGVSTSVQDLIMHMLDVDPATRYNLDQVKEHPWVTRENMFPLPPLVENCIQITVTEDEVSNAVKHVPRLATLILVKYMVQKGSFRNPFHSSSADRRSRFSQMRTRLSEHIVSGDNSYSPEPYGGTQGIPSSATPASELVQVDMTALSNISNLRPLISRTNSVPVNIFSNRIGSAPMKTDLGVS